MTEEEKEAREILNNTEWDGFMITIKNLIKKQDTEINSLKETIQKQEKSREHLKKQLKGEIAVKDTQINKLNNVIEEQKKQIEARDNQIKILLNKQDEEYTEW